MSPMPRPLLAHSARQPDLDPQLYADHILGVVAGARARAEAMAQFGKDAGKTAALVNAVVDAATYHDLGKLDPELQKALHKGRSARLGWDHIDAGVAHLRARGSFMAAWLVRGHHAPGLPSKPAHFARADDRNLRGRRRDSDESDSHDRQIERTDALLPSMQEDHHSALGKCEPRRGKVQHGLALRLALSCLVDADHSDTATFDSGWNPPMSADPRWEERLAALDRYVKDLGADANRRPETERARIELRNHFYNACRDRNPDASMIACEGPVGIGKTTAVTAHLLRRAIATGARRMFIVAPFTAILSQTAKNLRKALLLEDEHDNPDSVIAEHHHRADFANISSRDLAVLWSAPIILTTAVQFFETLAAAEPSALRKLHMLPGSVVFIDEAHAAVPVTGSRLQPSTAGRERVETPILPQHWRWLCELADDWSCSFVLASGSLARFWDIPDIAGDRRRTLPDLVPRELFPSLLANEAARVRYVTRGRFADPDALITAVRDEAGPRLLIMNTVQSAAVIASRMRAAGYAVLHLSTALCPRDRDAILREIERRLDPVQAHPADWTLVATSLMEAGVDVSFRTCFRERFATTSLIQIGGRGNRGFEWSTGATIHDFSVEYVEGLTKHPAATRPAEVLQQLLIDGRLSGTVDPASVVTDAMRLELRLLGPAARTDHLMTAEQDGNYPDVASLGRLIDADTHLVVVDPALRDRIAARQRITSRELLSGSVQLWTDKRDAFGLSLIPGRDDIFWWPHEYEPGFLGYMAGALKIRDFLTTGMAEF